ncbi:MAG: acetyl-CoA decarbonylase/synthase complex subunit gamma, partial [Firmicutes bacterium]|nr:acetyl-CoA decarbonylase/synthase complex subunit gamma [Bacillota bacterium]
SRRLRKAAILLKSACVSLMACLPRLADLSRLDVRGPGALPHSEKSAGADQVLEPVSREPVRSCCLLISGRQLLHVGGVAEAGLGEALAAGIVEKDAVLFAGPDGKVLEQARAVDLEEQPARLAAMEAALKEVGAAKPLIYAANSDNYEKMAALAKEYDTPLAVKGENLGELADLVGKVTAAGAKQLVLDTGAREVNQVLGDQTQLRRQALKRFRPFGYPSITFAANPDPVTRVVDAAVCIAKYAGIVVLDTADPADVLPLITLRLNIYTDPQKPIAVESKVYELLNPGPDAPVYVTTNFSLTYFCVAGDVEASRVPGYVLPVDTDGISVLTGWAAGKFTPEKITEMLQKSGIAGKVSHKKVIIPGGVAVLSGKLAELSGWEVLVGPRESAGIPSFVKQRWSAS